MTVRQSSGISVENLTKRFGDVVALDDVSLEVNPGEFVALLGPSGCGKTTLLRVVAGLETPTAGRVRIEQRDVTWQPPKDRDIAMVFQNYALYPQMTVGENLGFALKLRRAPKAEIRARVAEVASVLQIEDLLDRKPAALSGGQRQRVAMGRAMVRDPAAFLMDEPLSNLDARLRVEMRVELARLRDRLKATTLYVTHDQVEAITLGDRVAVFRDGRLQQFDTPRALFESPANIFVGAFIGSPAMNLVEAFIDDGFARFGGFAIPIPPGCDLTAYRQTSVILGIRPTDLSVAGGDARGRDGVLEVTADVVEDLGTAMHVVFSVEATAARIAGVTAEASSSETERSNTQALLTAEIDPDWSIGAGSPLALAVTGAVHFFDRDSGAAIASGETRPGEREQPTSSIQQGGTVR